MLKECTVNVPGKVIITGEHSVLQGCPAIAAACSRYITSHIIKNDTGKIEFKDKEPLPPVAYKLLNQAVEEFKRYFTLDSGVTMEFSSTLPIGSGMGSSAAVAASVFAGLCAPFVRAVWGLSLICCLVLWNLLRPPSVP